MAGYNNTRNSCRCARVAALKSLTVHRCSVVIFTFAGPLGMWVQHLFESRVALNLGLGGVKNVASAIISHEWTASAVFKNVASAIISHEWTASAVFKLWILYFQRMLFTGNRCKASNSSEMINKHISDKTHTWHINEKQQQQNNIFRHVDSYCRSSFL